MSLYAETKQAASRIALREDNDCAVIAISIATGEAYEKVHALLKRHGRRNRSGAPNNSMRRTIKDLGFVMNDVSDDYDAKTTKTLARGKLPKTGAFLVYSTRHVSAVVNGIFEDWAICRNKRITEIYEITSKTDVAFKIDADGFVVRKESRVDIEALYKRWAADRVERVQLEVPAISWTEFRRIHEGERND